MLIQHPITESPPLIQFYKEHKEDLDTVYIFIVMLTISFLGKVATGLLKRGVTQNKMGKGHKETSITLGEMFNYYYLMMNDRGKKEKLLCKQSYLI